MKHHKITHSTESGPIIPRHTPVDAEQVRLLRQFSSELSKYNKRVNLVSRETDEEIWKRHVAHCLCLSIRDFEAGATVIDWGTGGGLPAIPLAIMHPHIKIVGVDSVRKKTLAARSIARRIGLENCSFLHVRAEECPVWPDYSVSRATAPLATLWDWHMCAIARKERERSSHAGSEDQSHQVEPPCGPGPHERAHKTMADAPPARQTGSSESIWRPGLICLKGGDLDREIDKAMTSHPGLNIEVIDLEAQFDGVSGFEDKKILALWAESSDDNR